MNKKDQGQPWKLKVTWTLSIVMLMLIGGFFYQAYQEIREMAPVKVAVERVKAQESKAVPDTD